ncbi:unnamed protein product, partial [marine sediment metagenome]
MKLNFGCGRRKTPGYINIDISKEVKPDVVWDIENLSYPEEWRQVDAIRLNNLLEHVNSVILIDILNVLHRRMKIGGEIHITVPVIKSTDENLDAVFGDPTHINYFTERTFDYFDYKHHRYLDYGKSYGIIPWERIQTMGV